jgi:hypothetical protein
VAVLVAMGLMAPASAMAATVTVTGDDGNPAALTPGAPGSFRTINQTAATTLAANEAKSWKWTIVGPTGQTASIISTSEYCWTTEFHASDNIRINYQGNGAYTLTVQKFAGERCSGAVTNEVFTWNVGASVSLGQPGGPLLLRPANNLTSNTHLLDFAGNPGATYYEVKYAKGGVIGPDGGIAGPSNSASVDDATGKVKFSPFDGPGAYVMVARATYGSNSTPWSAPITINVQSPFDISNVYFPDRRGPSYQLAATVREKALAGSRVTVAVAKGKKGKKFRTLGKGKVSSKGIVKVRFRLARGTYRVRFSFSGNSLVQKGTQYGTMTIKRVIL